MNVINLMKQTLRKRCIYELDFFYRWSQSELGLKGIDYDAMVDAITLHTNVNNKDLTVSASSWAANMYSKVSQRLKLIDDVDRKILELAFHNDCHLANWTDNKLVGPEFTMMTLINNANKFLKAKNRDELKILVITFKHEHPTKWKQMLEVSRKDFEVSLNNYSKCFQDKEYLKPNKEIVKKYSYNIRPTSSVKKIIWTK